MTERRPADLVVRALEVEEFALPGEEQVYLSQCLIDGTSVGSKDLNVNRGTLKAGQKLKGGSHPVGSDECYYVLHGQARLALGGDPQTGEGAEAIEIGPETAIFIPNGVYDARLAAWGTSFRKRPSAPPSGPRPTS